MGQEGQEVFGGYGKTIAMNRNDDGTMTDADYVSWCKIQKVSPLGRQTFKEELTKHSVKKIKSINNAMCAGCKITSNFVEN